MNPGEAILVARSQWYKDYNYVNNAYKWDSNPGKSIGGNHGTSI